jgi:hypothetical protein
MTTQEDLELEATYNMAQKAKHGRDGALTDAVVSAAQSLRHQARAMAKVARRLLAVAVFIASTPGPLVIEQGSVR